MWPISRLRAQRYCAFCKVLRRVYVKKHVDLTNVLLAALFAAAVSFVYEGQLDPLALMIFVVSLSCAEIFVNMRWRMNLVCNLCGFDPILYKRSNEKAAARVKEFFREQVENPHFWLTKSPLLDVQKRIRLQEKKAIEMKIVANRAKLPPLAPSKTL